MQLLYLLTVSFFFTISLYAQDGTLKITVKGITNLEGAIAAALYDHPESFLKEDIKNIHYLIIDEKVQLLIPAIPPGTYAVSIFHDKNNNQKLDTNIVGIPREPYGFSNNVRGIFGPPGFEESSITIGAEQTTEIIIYLR